MGTTVLDADASPSQDLHLCAHCMHDYPGGVVLLAINADRAASQSMQMPQAADLYTLAAKHLLDNEVQLNGNTLSVGGEDSLPKIVGVAHKAGSITFAPVEHLQLFRFLRQTIKAAASGNPTIPASGDARH